MRVSLIFFFALFALNPTDAYNVTVSSQVDRRWTITVSKWTIMILYPTTTLTPHHSTLMKMDLMMRKSVKDYYDSPIRTPAALVIIADSANT